MDDQAAQMKYDSINQPDVPEPDINTASTDGTASAVDESASAGKVEMPTSSDVVIGGTGTPSKAQDMINQIKGNNGTPPKGYKGGRTFSNEPVGGGQKLPDGINYKEYDVNPYVKGQGRRTERIVIGDDGSSWYTNDHYNTFTKIE